MLQVMTNNTEHIMLLPVTVHMPLSDCGSEDNDAARHGGVAYAPPAHDRGIPSAWESVPAADPMILEGLFEPQLVAEQVC